jgi:type II secretory pathway component GspD/PulD (secretin)
VTTSKLRISSGKSGRLTVGQEVPTLGKTDYDKEGNAIKSVHYREAGLIVNLTPTIRKDHVYSDLAHEVSNFSVTKTSNIDSPTISKRSFTTSFTSDFGEVIFLGGLDEKKENEVIPGLFGFKFSNQKIESKTVLFLVLEYDRV